MRVVAIAARSANSNAIGRLELECTPHGLLIDYQGVGACAEGYAPGALAAGKRLLAPWAAIDEARAEADRVWLVLSRALTPLNQLMLTRFRLEESDGARDPTHRRAVLWLGIGVAWALLLLLGFALLHLELGSPSGVALALGLTASGALLVVGYSADRRLTRSVPETRVREAFLQELASYLPELIQTVPAPATERLAVGLSTLQAALPRTTSATVITLGALGLAALTTLNAVVQGTRAQGPDTTRAQALEVTRPPPLPASDPVLSLPATPATSVPPSPVTNVAATSCQCTGPESLLWKDGLPRLSTVVIDRRLRAHKNHFHLELQLAAVNNGSSNLDELTLRVHFFELDPISHRRAPTKERPLYFEGPLKPGHAIKWEVQARGTQYELRAPDLGVVGPDDGSSASPEAFARLLSANHRPVKMHGALMLSFLGDARARDAIAGLRDALRENEGPYLDRLLVTTGPVITCDTKSTPSQLPAHYAMQSCIFNRGQEPSPAVTLQARALHGSLSHAEPLADPPMVIAEQQATRSSLAPKTGERVQLELDTSNPDRLTADSFELQVLQP